MIDGRRDVVGDIGASSPPDRMTNNRRSLRVIPDTDGSAHHVRLSGIEAFVDAPPAGAIVEVRRFGGPDDPRPTWRRP
jgi:hypothetical protein